MDKLEYHELLQKRKNEETMFHNLLALYCSRDNKTIHPRELIAKIGINEKRAYYLISKFDDYVYGVSIGTGFIHNKKNN